MCCRIFVLSFLLTLYQKSGIMNGENEFNEEAIMKAVCVSNFNYYAIRVKYAIEYFEKQGYDVQYITGDYDTMNRQLYTLDIPQVIQIPLIQYRKNISFERIHSHLQFAQNVYRYLQEHKPDVVYAMVPPNFVAHYIAKYKRQNPGVTVIFDVFDMWPETFPNKHHAALALPFKLWRSLRERAMRHADCVLTECRMFETYLKERHQTVSMATIYPCQLLNQEPIDYVTGDDVISLCYLGSINNIIDIDDIERVLTAISRVKKVVLHVIGNGEQTPVFLERMQEICTDVVFHGNVYNPIEKQQIFNQCAFAINVLKPTVFIGLTLKTLDYLNGGLPLLNTVVGDTQSFIDDYGIGLNCHMKDDNSIAIYIQHLTKQDVLNMKNRAKEVFVTHFDVTHYAQRLDNVLHKYIKREEQV